MLLLSNVLSIFLMYIYLDFFDYFAIFSLSELLDFKYACYEQYMAELFGLIYESIFKCMDSVYMHLEYILYTLTPYMTVCLYLLSPLLYVDSDIV